MRVARNDKQLRDLILKDMKAAMTAVKQSALADMQEATDYFYIGREPKSYRRTYALGDTPSVSNIKVDAGGLMFCAYLDDGTHYTSGSRPSMGEVLRLADQGIPFTTRNGFDARPTVGNKGFWEKAEKEIEKSLYKIMGEYFL